MAKIVEPKIFTVYDYHIRRGRIAVIVVILICILLLLFGCIVEKETPQKEPVVLFQPDTIRIEVGGQIFRYGALTVFGEDTVTVGCFLHEPTASNAKP